MMEAFNVMNFIRCPYDSLPKDSPDTYIIMPKPLKGALFVTFENLGFISGQVRVRGKGGGEYPFHYLEMIDYVFGKEENFHNVIGYLLHDDLAGTAYRWLVGEEISIEDCKKLGVSGTIQTPALARWGIRFLATVFGRGGRPSSHPAWQNATPGDNSPRHQPLDQWVIQLQVRHRCL